VVGPRKGDVVRPERAVSDDRRGSHTNVSATVDRHDRPRSSITEAAR